MRIHILERMFAHISSEPLHLLRPGKLGMWHVSVSLPGEMLYEMFGLLFSDVLRSRSQGRFKALHNVCWSGSLWTAEAFAVLLCTLVHYNLFVTSALLIIRPTKKVDLYWQHNCYTMGDICARRPHLADIKMVVITITFIVVIIVACICLGWIQRGHWSIHPVFEHLQRPCSHLHQPCSLLLEAGQGLAAQSFCFQIKIKRLYCLLNGNNWQIMFR